jgi:transposase
MEQQTVRKTFKYQLVPTPEQEQALETVVWRCRALYNAGLQERKAAWERRGVSVTFAMQSAQLPAIKEVRAAVDSLVIERPAPIQEQLQGLCLDAGYDYDEVYAVVHEFGFTAHVRSRGEEAKALQRESGFHARRWVVERAHSWLNRFRRLVVRWDKKPEQHLAFLQVACGLIALRAAGVM